MNERFEGSERERKIETFSRGGKAEIPGSVSSKGRRRRVSGW